MKTLSQYIAESKSAVVVFALQQGKYVEIGFEESFCKQEGHSEQELISNIGSFDKISKMFPSAYVEIDGALSKSFSKKIKEYKYNHIVFVEYEDEYDQWYLI